MRYMRDYYAPDGYNGCSNCAHQPSRYNLCDYGKEHPSIVACPRWQMRLKERVSEVGERMKKMVAQTHTDLGNGMGHGYAEGIEVVELTDECVERIAEVVVKKLKGKERNINLRADGREKRRMSILVKGMQMPNDCFECPLSIPPISDDSPLWMCGGNAMSIHEADTEERRPFGCPLVEVEE